MAQAIRGSSATATARPRVPLPVAMAPPSDDMDKAAMESALIELVKTLGSVDVAAGDDLEEKGVDSMDMASIQKALIDKAPEKSKAAGMDKDNLKLGTDGFKTVSEIAGKMFS